MSKINLLSVVEDEVIQTEAIPLSHLWMLFDQKQVYGPFRETDLRTLAHQNIKEFKELLACSLDSNEWKPLFEISSFDRRSNKTENPDEKIYHRLKTGKVEGPYSKNQITSMIDNKEVSIQEYLSLDKGLTWKKLYELNIIDRRDYQENIEPISLNLEEFIIPAQKKIASTATSIQEDHEGHEKIESPVIEELGEKRSINFFKPKLVASVAIFIFAIFGISKIMPSFENEEKQTIVKALEFKEVEKKVSPQKIVKPKVKRPSFRVVRKLNSRNKVVKKKRNTRSKSRIIRRKPKRRSRRTMSDVEIVGSMPIDEEIEPPNLELEAEERELASEGDEIPMDEEILEEDLD